MLRMRRIASSTYAVENASHMCAASVDHLVQVQLALRTLLDTFLHCALRHEAVHVHRLVLADTVHTGHGLQQVKVDDCGELTVGEKRSLDPHAMKTTVPFL